MMEVHSFFVFCSLFAVSHRTSRFFGGTISPVWWI